ncbi:MAG TPA: PA14 domain-containing protein [Ohtaekwangia sp.]|uniref:fibronectin type III domain-containing protein n=1 Tax=Ohtaekwangia sp. TaxID=2066019 RepID=UPI002F93797A
MKTSLMPLHKLTRYAIVTYILASVSFTFAQTVVHYDSGYTLRNNQLGHYYKMTSFANESSFREYTYWKSTGATVNEFLNFRVIFPNGFDKNNTSVKYPLILMLHGAGESGRSWEGHYEYTPADPQYDNNSTNTAHAGPSHAAAVLRPPSDPRAFPGIVIIPQASYSASWQNGWQNGALSDNMRMTIGVVEYFIQNYNADRDRIVIHGLSNGAKGVWDAASKRPDLFAAMLAMSGVGSAYNTMSDILVTMPIKMYQGGLDTNPLPQASHDLYNLLKSKGANPSYTLYPDLGHDTWNRAYGEADFFSWILAQNKKNIYVFGQQTEICANGSIRLGFSDGFSGYQWTFNGADIPNATTRFYTLNQPGTYTVKFQRSATEWDESFPVVITPKSASTYTPDLTNTGTRIIPIDFNGTKNDTLKLIAPEGFPEYYWYKNGAVFDTTTTNTKVAHFLTGSGTVGTTAEAGTFAVRVKENSGCESLLSPSITVTYTSPHVGPTAPTLAASGISAISENQVQLQWTDNSSNEEYFEIWRNRSTVNGYSSEPYRLVATVPANTTSYTDSGLRPMAKYFYRVRSAGGGDGKFATTEVNITMPSDTTKPAPPMNLTATDVEDTQISIGWDPSSDDDQVAGYEIYLGSVLDTTVNTTSYTFYNLTPGTNYLINVRAVDARGNFSDFPGEALSVTTLAPQHGLQYYYYEPLTVPNTFTLLDYFDTTHTIVKQGVVNNFDISVRNRDIKFVFAFEGFIKINQTGNYIFYSKSDDGSRLFIDGVLQIDNDGLHEGTVEKSKTVNFTTTGKHSIRVEYFYANSLAQTLAVTYDPPGTGTGLGKQTIPDTLLYRTNATPMSYYCKATGDLGDLATWGTETNGQGASPASFTGSFEYFYICNRSGAVSITSPWAVNGTGSKIVVGAGVTLNVNEAITGILEAGDNAVININSTTIPTLGSLAPTSTVNFNATGTVPNAAYGNLNLMTASTTKTLPLSSVAVRGNLHIDQDVLIQGADGNKSILAVEGDMIFLGSENNVAGQLYTINFKGGKPHTLTLNPDTDLNLYELVLDYGDQLTLQNSSGTPAHVRLGNTSGGGLTLNTGATLQLDKNNLILSGKVALNGNGETGEIATTGGSININTTSAVSSNLFFNEDYDSLTNLTLSSASTAKFLLQSPVNVKNLVTITKGEVNAGDGNLVLTSDKNGSARIGPLLSGARITGNIVFQRYMDGEGRIYRYIASPVKYMSIADLQQYIPVTGPFEGHSTGKGYHETTSSLFYYDEANGGWLGFPGAGGSNTDTLRIGKGYAIFVRDALNPTTWQITGNPHQGNFTFPLTGGTLGQDNGWNLLGNPYPSPIQWTGVAGTGWSTLQNVSNTVYIRENFGTEYRWRVWNGTTGNLPNGIIAPGQSFWVQTTSGAPAITITENAKYTTDGAFYREDQVPAIAITMSNGTLHDETYIQLARTATNGYNKQEDAVKQENTYFNLASASEDSVALAINILSADYCMQRIPLYIRKASKGNYTLTFDGIENIRTKVYLNDAFLQKQQEIASGQEYTFAITDDAHSYNKRFSLILDRPAVPAITSFKTSNACEGNANVTLQGTTADVGYQAFLGDRPVSARTLSTGDSCRLELDYTLLHSGTFDVTVRSGYGASKDCPAVTQPQTIRITIDSLAAPHLTLAGNTISTVNRDGQRYQWYKDGAWLAAENSYQITPVEDGDYSVAVTAGSCYRLSDTIRYTITGLETALENVATVSPNPFTDRLNIRLRNHLAKTISLSTTVGKVIVTKSINETDEYITLDLTDLAQGTYILSIGDARYKVIKKT